MYVLFSAAVSPHANAKTQQTPNPEAHDPSVVPPFDEHSSAV
jgi:hypothetical protein